MRKEKRADPNAKTTDPAPPIKDFIWDKLEAQIVDIEDSRLIMTLLNISNRNAGRILCRMRVNFVWNLLRVSMVKAT